MEHTTERSDAGRLLALPFLTEVSNIHRRIRHGSVDLSAGAAANLNWTLTLAHHEPERFERCGVALPQCTTPVAERK